MEELIILKNYKMSTKEILEKYKKLISEILNCDKDDILFCIGNSKEELIHFEYIKAENEDYCIGNYVVYLKKENNFEIISCWVLFQLPYCCAFIISCGVSINLKFRNKKIGIVLNKMRQDIGKHLNFTSLLCTDIETNRAQRKILKNNGWKDIHEIINKKTNNRVYLSVINL